VKDNRPVNLNLATFKWPITAISSILHRVSGVLLFLMVPFCFWALEKSLQSKAEFNHIQQIFNLPFFKFLVWSFLSLLSYHLIAGIRHLLMDAGVGESLKSGIIGSQMVLFLGGVFAIILGVWIW
jgi:succinate dehydrogenase / fumarate reductase cytochrome b subunit